jgi:hypothetical protein
VGEEVAAAPAAAHEEALEVREHQPLRLADGKAAEEGLVDEREDRRVRPDAEPDGENGDDGENPVASQAPNGVSHVVRQPVEHGGPPAMGR